MSTYVSSPVKRIYKLQKLYCSRLKQRLRQVVYQKHVLLLCSLLFCSILFLHITALYPVLPLDPVVNKSANVHLPFILHFLWIENRKNAFPYDLTALQYLSFLSAFHHTPTTTIWFHTNGRFAGPYWEAVRSRITVQPFTTRYTEVNGKPVKVIEQEADLIKLDLAIRYGGFFVDFDVFFTGPVDHVREKLERHECVFRAVAMKQWTLFHMGNFACHSNSDFLREIRRDYHEDYRGSCYSRISAVYNGCLYAYLLYTKNAKFQRTVYVDKGELLGQFEKTDGYTFRLGPQRVVWNGHVNIHTGDEEKELSFHDMWTRNSSFGDMLRQLITETSFDGYQSTDCLKVKNRVPELVFAYGVETVGHDLTNTMYLAILSALKFSAASSITVRLREEDYLSGPLTRHLQQIYPDRITFIHKQCIKPEMTGRDHSQVSDVLANTFFIPSDIARKLQRGFTTSNPTTGGSPRRKTIFEFEDLAAENITAVRITKLEEDMSFGAIRKTHSLLGRLFRLILYNVTSKEVLKDTIAHKFPCID